MISVIVPVYNAEKTIKNCVESLLNQDCPKTYYELIVVDNNSPDNSMDIIKSYPIKIVVCLEKGSYAARNEGARHANGEILAFTDADCEVSKNWLKEIDNSFIGGNIAAVQGPGNRTLQNNLKVKVECLSRTMSKEKFWGDTKNFAVRKSVFDAVGGFNSFITGCDALFFQTLLLKRHNIEFNDNMIVFHVFPTDFLKLIRKNWKHGFGDVFIAKKISTVKRVLEFKYILYTNFRRSLKVFFLDNSLLEKIYMWLYYIIALDVRSLSYIVHSLSPKILFADKCTEGDVKNKRLKAAYVLRFFPKLSQSFVMNEIVELIKRGYDVQIFSWYSSSETIVHEEIKEYRLLNRTHYFAIKQIFEKNSFKFLKYFVKAMMYSLAAKRISRSELKIDLKLAYFATIMEEKNIELIHAHFGGVGNYSIRLRQLLKKPLIVSFYGFDAAIADSTTYAELFKSENVITVLSNDMKKDLIKLGCSEKKLIIHPFGVNLNKFSYNERHMNPSEKIKFLCVGRFVEKKGIIYAIKAFSKLLLEHKNIELRIIGDGKMRKEIENLIYDLEIQNEVILLGSHPHSKVIEEMHSSHIFILPSITAGNGDKEGTPTVLMEAQATGMPVISTYHAGVPEVVIDGKTGYLVKEKDVNSLYKKMDYLVKHPELWNEIGKNGRKHIEEKYNISKQVAILEEIYKSLMIESEC